MDASATRFGEMPYRVMLFDEAIRLLQAKKLFSDGNKLDVLHCWTPREKLRKFCARLGFRDRGHYATLPRVIHLEDNEWQLARSFLGEHEPCAGLRGKLPREFPDSLTDPPRRAKPLWNGPMVSRY